jgi:hypothetical protein
MRYFILLVFLLISHFCSVNSQDTIMADGPFKSPGKRVDFPVQYCLFLPSDYFAFWKIKQKDQIESNDSNAGNLLTRLSIGDDLRIRLDSSTFVKNTISLTGAWKSILVRSIEIKDSMSFANYQVFRRESILNNNDKIEFTIMFKDNEFCSCRKLARKNKYRKQVFDYQLVDGRILRYSKSIIPGMANIGINEDGIMIIQYAEIKNMGEEGVYKAVRTRISQVFLERISIPPECF